MKDFEPQATSRVNNNILLVAYYEILIIYPWKKNHFEWVANAPISEILDWCLKTLARLGRV